MMNSLFMIDHAKTLAQRLLTTKGDDAERIRLAYALLFARDPEKQELAMAREFLQQTTADTTMTNWQQFAQALLATNEMLYVD
jgi:hypothetical protein